MLRKTLIALTAIAALGIGSTAMAMHGGGGGFGGGGGWHGGGGGGHASAFHTGFGHPGFRGHPFAHHAFFAHHGHFFPHRHFAFFRHRHFFGVGLYASASCWTWLPTRFGWRRIWVCDY